MLGHGSDRRAGQGWKRSAGVGVVAAIVALAAFGYVVTRLVGRGGGSAPPLEQLTLICPDCGEVYKVSRKDMGLEGTGETEQEADLFAIKARQVPCPKCKSADSRIAFHCRQCNKPFLPPARQTTGGEPFRCPHCGKDPWTKPK